MAARVAVDHAVRRHVLDQVDLRVVAGASAERLTLLIVGILASHSAVLYRMARHLERLARAGALHWRSALAGACGGRCMIPSSIQRPVIGRSSPKSWPGRARTRRISRWG